MQHVWHYTKYSCIEVKYINIITIMTYYDIKLILYIDTNNMSKCEKHNNFFGVEIFYGHYNKNHRHVQFL